MRKLKNNMISERDMATRRKDEIAVEEEHQREKLYVIKR